MERGCICNICSCGRHRCPQLPTALYYKGDKVHVQTEYAEKYPLYGPYEPPKSMKPKLEYQKNWGKMDGTTTFKSDYILYEITPRHMRRQAEARPRSGEIDLRTTYKLDFDAYPVHPVMRVRPSQRFPLREGRLETLPTYQDDFRQWEFSKRKLAKPDVTYHPPSEKFGNATTFQDAFVPRGLVPRESFKPSNIAKLSPVPFDSLTSNRISFVPHILEPRYVRAPEEYKPSNQPFQGHTTHQSDFQGLPSQPPKSCKPEVTKVSSDAPLESCTEFRDRFQQWPVTLPQRPKSVEHKNPTEPMNLCTTTKSDYIRHNVQPFVPTKPSSQRKSSTAPFQGNTTMKEDFKPWMVKRQEAIRTQENPPKAHRKMDTMTTFKQHYTQHKIQPTLNFKPKNVPMKTAPPFEDATMYRMEFTPKTANVCPASFDSPPGYVFEESDGRGHRFFHKQSTQDRNKMAVTTEVPAAKELVVMS